MESLPAATRWKLEVLFGQVTVEVGVAPLLPVPPGPVLVVAPHPVTTRAASAARPIRPTRRRRGPWLSGAGCARPTRHAHDAVARDAARLHALPCIFPDWKAHSRRSEAKLAAMLAQPAALRLVLRAGRCDQRPETRGVIGFFEVC